jgi:hypothetical protein
MNFSPGKTLNASKNNYKKMKMLLKRKHQNISKFSYLFDGIKKRCHLLLEK